MKFILNNIELLLSGIGLLVIWLAPSLVVRGQYDIWKATAVTAIVVGLIHGFIFWLIRRRQRIVRQEAIREIRLMLSDMINNQLTIIMAGSSDPRNIEQISDSVRRISHLIQTLSEESLTEWKRKYKHLLEWRLE